MHCWLSPEYLRLASTICVVQRKRINFLVYILVTLASGPDKLSNERCQTDRDHIAAIKAGTLGPARVTADSLAESARDSSSEGPARTSESVKLDSGRG